ncbi:MAG: hypothetical protein AEth_00738 [Candidatus Argoarchaeum ethanivorans]|uniref:Uncharacterized protein n=1 Tax=Candidatus Argoarchaeum ethanivorans TaxID=2608793 RepID=A0A8B3S2H2_9EURY|nr:MAG: hypothetical protein AEth_00738 [Candidatus Argoarchaeum ethanivorans]
MLKNEVFMTFEISFTDLTLNGRHGGMGSPIFWLVKMTILIGGIGFKRYGRILN